MNERKTLPKLQPPSLGFPPFEWVVGLANRTPGFQSCSQPIRQQSPVTLHGLKADIVHLMNMSQHERLAFVNWTMWRNDYIIAMGQTADHTNARFKVVCCGTQNHVITPSAILFHVYQVFSPCLMSMDKVKQICSIRL